MTFEVQQTRWDRLIRRVTGSIGPGSRVSETLSELFPVLDIERVPGELLLLGGTRLGTAGFPLTAGATQFAASQLQNPPGSNALIILTRVIMVAEENGSFLWGTVHAPLALPLPVASRLRDTREVFPVQPVGLLRTQTDLGVPIDSLGQLRIQAFENYTLEDDNGVAILAPGESFTVGHDFPAATINVNWFWRERPAETAELQF